MDRLKKRAQFVDVAKGARLHRDAFSLQARRQKSAGEARIGFTVTKKTGNAVERNRIRRRLKAAAAQAAVAAQPGIDYVVVARRSVLGAPFSDLRRTLERALATVDPDKRRRPRAHANEGHRARANEGKHGR